MELDIISLVAGVFFAGVMGFIFHSKRTNELDKEISRLQFFETNNAEIKTELDKAVFSYNELKEKYIQLEAKSQAELKNTRERLVEIGKANEEFERRLKEISAEALNNNNSKFLELAKGLFEEQRKAGAEEHKAKEKSLNDLLKPIGKTLDEFKSSVEEVEKSRKEAYGNIKAELKNVVESQEIVRTEALKLANALKGSSKVRGNWGEESLKNVMELSGMSAHCDFNTEVSIKNKDVNLRPDVIINMPGDRKLIVDAKTSLDAYLDAIEAEEEVTKKAFLSKHAQQIKDHIKNLSSKSYQNNLQITPDFVCMYIPGDHLYTAALEADHSLFEFAVNRNILLVTPSTLIALTKAINYGWKQQKASQNAQEIVQTGEELYKRMTKMGATIQKLGRNIETSNRTYNEMIGTLESSVLPSARRLKDNKLVSSTDDIKTLDTTDVVIRPLKGKDLELPSK